MISRKAKYGIKAMVILAQRSAGDEVVGIGELAQRERMPLKFLEAILVNLKNDGLLQSKRGRYGGYTLARPAEQIRLSEVMRSLDGPIAPVPCISQTAYARCDECVSEERCSVRILMMQVRDAMMAVLDRITLADLVTQLREAPATSTEMMFYI